MAKKMKNQTMWVILGVLGLGGLIFLLRKPAEVVAIPAVAPALGVPAVAVPEVPLPAGCEGQIIAMAERQLGLPRSELRVRSLRAADLGLTTFSVNLAAVGWNTGVINTAVNDNTFICLRGITYSGVNAETVRVSVGASVVAEFSVERATAITTTHHINIPEIIAQQNTPIRVDMFASAISANENVIFEGVICEKAGLVVA